MFSVSLHKKISNKINLSCHDWCEAGEKNNSLQWHKIVMNLNLHMEKQFHSNQSNETVLPLWKVAFCIRHQGMIQSSILDSSYPWSWCVPLKTPYILTEISKQYCQPLYFTDRGPEVCKWLSPVPEWVTWATETEPEEGLSNSIPETLVQKAVFLWRVQGHPGEGHCLLNAFQHTSGLCPPTHVANHLSHSMLNHPIRKLRAPILWGFSVEWQGRLQQLLKGGVGGRKES